MKNKIKEVLFICGGLFISGLSLSLGRRYKTESKEKEKELSKRISSLTGQLENQKEVIEGLQRIIERTSYINGKLNQKLYEEKEKIKRVPYSKL